MAAPTLGVLALQGAFHAHATSFREVGLKVREIRRVADMDGLGALMIPGGESTTLLNLMEDEPWFDRLRCFHDEGGRCARRENQHAFADANAPREWHGEETRRPSRTERDRRLDGPDVRDNGLEQKAVPQPGSDQCAG